MSDDHLVGKPVIIDWIDSNSFAGWQSIERWRERVVHDRMICQTVGYLILDAPTFIAVAQSCGEPTGPERNFGDVMQIPRVAVVQMTFVEPEKLRQRCDGG